MQMVCGFEPLFDRLLYIRHLAMMRPAIPVPIDPIKCWISFYFTLNKQQEVIYSTDKKPTYRANPEGTIYF